MKLSRIDITHFRCFETLTIPLQPDINVFVGVNAAGKTAILDAIAIALYHIIAANGGGDKRQRAAQNATLRPLDIHMSDIHLSPTSKTTVTVSKAFVQIKAVASSYYALPGIPAQTPSGEQAFIEWTEYSQYLPPRVVHYEDSQSSQLRAIYRYFEALWEEVRSSAPKALIPFPIVAYYRADRRLAQMPKMGDIFERRLERQGAYQHALDAGANYQAMCQWFYLRENQELRERRNNPTIEFPDLKAVRLALVRTLENVERVFFDDNSSSLKVEFTHTYGSPKILELAQLSDGHRNVLGLVLDFARRLAQAHPNWDNPLDAPGILLIDEIELHLHPGWQQSIIPNLRTAFPNTQLILTTNSPQVLTTVRKEHVQVLTAHHTLESLPEDVGTYGSESAVVLEVVFGVHTRPKTIETVDKLQIYLELVETRRHASEAAKRLRAELEADLGTSDPSLIRADMRIRQLEILSKR
jgi:predicted ATP-binding protein involved in virulence